MKFILWLVAFTILFIIWIRYVERHSIYYPMKEVNMTPMALGLVYEDVYFNTSDNKKLHSWFIPSKDARLTLLFAHGNAGNISHRLDKISIFNMLGLNVFIFDYRGYGKSEGMASEAGLYKDVFAAYNYLTKERKVKENDIILYGESLGAAVIIDLAYKAEVGALITEEAFTSVKDMARIAYPFVPPFIFSSKFDSVSKVRYIICQKLIIHSVDDEIVPFYLGEKLFNAAAKPKKFLKIRGSHNTAFFDSEQEFEKGIKSFLDEL